MTNRASKEMRILTNRVPIKLGYFDSATNQQERLFFIRIFVDKMNRCYKTRVARLTRRFINKISRVVCNTGILSRTRQDRGIHFSNLRVRRLRGKIEK